MLGYHLVNVICHSASALLLVAIIRRLGLPDGWMAGSVFALHPVMAESVAWIAEQKNTLSGLLYLGAAWLYLGYMERRTPGRYAAATLCFVAALLTKTVTATLPFALLVVLWWRDGARGMRRDGLRLLPWIVAGVVAGLITIAVERTLITGIDARFALSWTERLLVAGRALWFHAAKLIWPANLSFLYDRRLPTHPGACCLPAAISLGSDPPGPLRARSRG